MYNAILTSEHRSDRTVLISVYGRIQILPQSIKSAHTSTAKH